ncbi:Fur family transcriptional regulator [Brucellaceae bacterium C25G]
MSAHHHHHETELTRNQSLVFDVLRKADAPVSAYTILDQLRGEGIRAPLQIYRALDKLLEFGMVHRVESLNAFVACADPHCSSHGITAFAICEKCGQVNEFADPLIEDRVRQWGSQHGFKASKTTLELRGLCTQCQAAA